MFLYTESHNQMCDLLHELADDEHLYHEPRQNWMIKALTKKDFGKYFKYVILLCIAFEQ